MKADVYTLKGTAGKQVDLPKQFEEEVRAEIIRRAVLSDESRGYQPQGPYRWAGTETSGKYRGRKGDYGSLKNRGQAMLPREVRPEGLAGKVVRIPSAVKGRRAHPPKPEKKIIEKINKKEYRKALLSAIAATAYPELVKARGHLYEGGAPLVFEDALEKVKKTKEVISALEGVIGKDLNRAKEKRRARSGVRSRKAGTKTPKSALIVVSGGDILKSARNLAGVDVIAVENLKVKDLAPGTHPGRLTVYTEAALKKIGEL
jgi:large subunit ribosomal protein L4e